jgi:hypothetical protein
MSWKSDPEIQLCMINSTTKNYAETDFALEAMEFW